MDYQSCFTRISDRQSRKLDAQCRTEISRFEGIYTATIRTRQRKDGSLAYLSEVRVKRNGKIVHRESRTFDRDTFYVDEVFVMINGKQHYL
jgi:hypothetical protein